MQIMLPHGARKQLAKDFKKSRICVWKALTGQTNSELANMIRAAAFQRGGVVYNQAEPKEIEVLKANI